MIRLRIKSTRLMREARNAVILAIAVVWIFAGWLIMVPYSESSDKTLVPWQLGLAIWLGPWVVGGFVYLCVRTLRIEFISPRRLMREALERGHR